MTRLSQPFSRRITATFKKEGTEWLQRLPSLLGDLADRWKVDIGAPFTEAAYNFVAPAARPDGSQVVVKVGVPRNELRTEIAALRAYRGSGAVRLLDAIPELGALLLEKLVPGMPVLNLGDDEAETTIAIQVMQRMWKPAPVDVDFPTVSDWALGFDRLRERFDGGTGPFPQGMVSSAESMIQELLPSTDKPVLLHGDLHHWNILSAQREPWLAIDPKGVIGEPAYEVGAWLRNPFPQILKLPNPKRLIARRIDQFSEELGFEPERIKAWGYSQAVLSAWWGYEDSQVDWENWLRCAELLATSD